MLFMADFQSNGLHEKVKWYVTKSRLNVQFGKKILLDMVLGQQMNEDAKANINLVELKFSRLRR